VSSSVISIGLGLGGGKASTSSGVITGDFALFTTASLANGQTAISGSNTLTLTLQPAVDITAGGTILLKGLTSSTTANNSSLALSGTNAAIFGNSASWAKTAGTLTLTVAGGQTLSTGADSTISFTLSNPIFASTGVSSVQLSSSGFITASISGTFLNTVPTFNIATRDTEANILASAPTNPSGEVTIAFGTDTHDFYIYDGTFFNVYNNDS
jgi:hypothetical protein